MNVKKTSAAQLMTLRQAIRDHLPFCETFVTYDMIVLIMAAHETETAINIKAINALLPYSPSYMRQIFRDLEKAGLIEVTRDPRDMRNSIVRPSAKLSAAFDLFGSRAASVVCGSNDSGYDIKAAVASLA